MKSYIVAFVAACVIVSTVKAALDISIEQKVKLDQYRDECKTESGVDIDILKKLREGVFTDDEKFKNFLFCVSKKVGFQNEEGEVQEEVIVEKLGNAIKDSERAKELAGQCVKQEGTPSEVVYKVVTCLYNSSPNHIVIVH